MTKGATPHKRPPGRLAKLAGKIKNLTLIAVLLCIWQYVSVAVLDSTSRVLLPPPSAIFSAAWELISSGELKVFGPDGAEVPHDGETLGEIVVKGNVVMKGYYNDPEATAKAMAGGWFHTGDAAVVHPDGYAEIRDRFKDVIISGGENISSIEVESTLLKHPAVQEVAVVGLPHEKWGESPHAFLILKAGASVTPEELRAFCRTHLAHFKVPQGFHVVDQLPKTATGKIQKFVLRGQKPNIARQ